MSAKKTDVHFALAVADFYADIAEEMLKSAKDAAGSMTPLVMRVPGALELPMALKIAAESDFNVVAMAALGCVVRGETYHFEVVANTCASGIMQVQLQTGIPIGNGVLTVNTKEQAQRRCRKKAQDAVNAALALWLLKP
ncbi:MAG: 6,7-dimethyl-8-ribityllumazine synthase [Gammaproteobacteria bacterium]